MTFSDTTPARQGQSRPFLRHFFRCLSLLCTLFLRMNHFLVLTKKVFKFLCLMFVLPSKHKQYRLKNISQAMRKQTFLFNTINPQFLIDRHSYPCFILEKTIFSYSIMREKL